MPQPRQPTHLSGDRSDSWHRDLFCTSSTRGQVRNAALLVTWVGNSSKVREETFEIELKLNRVSNM